MSRILPCCELFPDLADHLLNGVAAQGLFDATESLPSEARPAQPVAPRTVRSRHEEPEVKFNLRPILGDLEQLVTSSNERWHLGGIRPIDFRDMTYLVRVVQATRCRRLRQPELLTCNPLLVFAKSLPPGTLHLGNIGHTSNGIRAVQVCR